MADQHPDAYLSAALERAKDAERLLAENRFGAACWVSGVAVECLFRAYHSRLSSNLETGHNLDHLFKASGFAAHLSEKQFDAVATDLSIMRARWRHNFRYRPEPAIRSSIAKGTSEHEFRKRVTDVVNASIRLTSLGASQWTSSRN